MSNMFGNPGNFGSQSSFGSQQSSPFGAQNSGQSAMFGQQTGSGLFGQSSTSTMPSFGQQQTSSMFGVSRSSGPSFGTQSPTGAFGQSSQGLNFGSSVRQPSSFGQTSPAFGSPSATQNDLQFGSPGQSSSSGFGAFGQQTTSSPLFGTQTTKPSMFGQPSAPMFGQSTTTQSTVFGQQTTSPAFGQPAASAQFEQTTGSSPFGQSTGFGPTTTTSTSTFTQSKIGGFTFDPPGSTSSFGQSSAFGQTSPSFGGQSSTAFGGTTGLSSAPAAGATGTAFGRSTTSTNQGMFNVSTTGQSIFGGTKTSTVPSIFGGTTISTSSAFGGPPSTGIFPQRSTNQSKTSFASPVAFGAPFGSSSSGKDDGLGTSQGFPPGGKPRGTAASAGSVSSQNLFGGTTSRTNCQSITTASASAAATSPVNLFGKVKQESLDQRPASFNVTARRLSAQEEKTLNPPSTMFVISGLESKPIAATASIKTEEQQFETGKLFGKVVTTSQPGTSTSTFGRSGGNEVRAKTGIFGRGEFQTTGSTKRAPQTLFGKAVAQTSQQGQGQTSDDQRSRFSWKRKDTSNDDQAKEGRKPSNEGDEEPRAKRASLSRMTSVEDTTRVAIICKNVPARFNNAFQLKKHFEKFGAVVRVFPNPTKAAATVHFRTHEEAAEARRRGRLIEKGVRPMEIFWSTYSPAGSRAVTRKSSGEETPGPSKRSAEGIVRRKNPVKKGLKWESDDVEDELSSMSGTEDVAQEKVQKLERPRDPDIGGARGEGSRRSSPLPGPSTSETSLAPQKVDRGSIAVLKNTIAHNTTEKLNSLNLRDKILRFGTKRTADLEAQAFVGTCQDMCPEKERYDREEKRRLHVYEVLKGTEANPQVDHTRAVKEYSRSSADQEEPLPHELRTLSTLTTTMTYLLTEIAGLGEDGKWGDWFDFLWNRTRGIRKEITQQQLCSMESAGLLEKCVRFHIFCAERLCEEDMHSFDAKINDENMTKCLQTLKEFYHDLEVKQNTFCQNEAEMRCYIVLMNLNEGDTLRETQQLRPEVRNSTFINFALQVYSALNSHNFVRFFRLVKQGSFLCACIMHRYFTQVRFRALNVLLRSHHKKTQLPLQDLVRILGFEDKAEAGQFCEFYGLQANADYVTLDRTAYFEPEEKWPPRRSPGLIESKRKVTVGEAINGEPLPPLVLPVPTCSFDQNGRFIGNLDVQLTDITDSPSKPSIPQQKIVQVPAPSPSASATSVVAPPTEPPKPVVIKPKPLVYTNEVVKEIAKTLFLEVIDEHCDNIAMETMRDVGKLMELSSEIYQEICDDVVKEISQMLGQSIVTELLKAEKEARMQRCMVVTLSEIIKEVLDQEILNAATVEIREVKSILKKQQLERCAQSLSEEILDDAVQELSNTVSEDVYQTDVVQRQEDLARREKSICLLRTKHWWERWTKELAARKKLKRSMLDFPSGPSLTLAESVEKLSGRPVSLDEDGYYVCENVRLSPGSPYAIYLRDMATDHLHRARLTYKQACHLRAWTTVDLCGVAEKEFQKLGKTLNATYKGKYPWRKLYWKLVISLPDPENIKTEHQGKSQEYLKKWLRSKFPEEKLHTYDDTHDTSKNTVWSLYTCDTPTFMKLTTRQLAVCVRAVEGVVTDFGPTLLGTSALVFVLPPAISEDPELLYWTEESHRLDDILRSRPSHPAISLVVICPISTNDRLDRDFICRCLNLEDYLEEGFISDFHMYAVPYDEDLMNGIDLDKPEINDQFDASLQWLLSNFPLPPPLRVKSLTDFVTSFVDRAFFKPVLHDLEWRKSKGFLHQDMDSLIGLFRDVVNRMSDMVQSTTSLKYSWPMAEMAHVGNELPPVHWRSSAYQNRISEVIQDLTLPWFDDSDTGNCDWSVACQDVMNYVTKIQGNKGVESAELMRRVEMRLQRTQEEFSDLCRERFGEEGIQPLYDNAPWTDIVLDCVNYKLHSMDCVDHTHLHRGQTEDEPEMKVAYTDTELQKFLRQIDWQGSEKVDKTEVTSDVTLQIAEEKYHKLKSMEIKPTLQPTIKHSYFPVDPLPQSKIEAEKAATDLHLALEEEKRETERIGRDLQLTLQKGNITENVLREQGDDDECESVSFYDTPHKKVLPMPLQRRHLNLDMLNVSLFSNLSSESTPKSPSDYNDTLASDQESLSVWEKMNVLEEKLGLEKSANEDFEKELENLIAEGNSDLPGYLNFHV